MEKIFVIQSLEIYTKINIKLTSYINNIKYLKKCSHKVIIKDKKGSKRWIIY